MRFWKQTRLTAFPRKAKTSPKSPKNKTNYRHLCWVIQSHRKINQTFNYHGSKTHVASVENKFSFDDLKVILRSSNRACLVEEVNKCHALLPGVPIFTTKNDESWWRMDRSKCRYNMLCMDPMALATYRVFCMLFITCYFSRAFNNDLFWELLSKLRKFKPESLLENHLLLPFLGPGSLVHPRRLTARTWKWWLGSDDSPLPGGPYSQVPAVNLPGCNNF